ncbi:SPOR domain-containing protein [Rhodopseudomonas palustris]|uniref:SPOR domain-containing protein n=1 Tax=Rhodopseudomonas palustris TaxID=1076 RepID=UPI0020CD8EDB|nr:SPOR domain-containing protein [Rhodopseudomonas palustris]MCP9626861.1 SPOR domain-containing protein [Rhodopseudomonas palustris]
MTDRYHDRPFPADDEETRAAYAQHKPDNDPLAELARLIGQTDPFGSQLPPPQSRPASRTTDFRPSTPLPPLDDDAPQQPMPSWLQHRRAAEPEPAPVQPRPDFSKPPSFVKAAAPRLAESRGYDQPRYTEPRFEQPQFDPVPVQPSQFDQQQFDQQFDPHQYGQAQIDPRPAPDSYAAAQPSLPLEQPQFVPARYDDALYGQPDPFQVRPDANYPESPYGYDDGYAEEPDARAVKPRRNSMVTVAAVLALAVVGTGGAFAYRTFIGGSRSGEPPVIKADPTPTKVMAAPASGDAAGKPIQDRLAAGNGVEALVSREEQPADPSRAGQGARVVLPQLNPNPNPPSVGSVSPGQRPNLPPSSNGASGSEEPRRIKTFSIRPDQADQAAAPVNTVPAKQAARTPPTPSAQQQRPATRQVEDANASAGAAPLSLNPNAPAQTNQRVAALPPAETPATSGGYVVQISSQRSEADAKASYRALQNKFPSVLGSRPPLIKRADLGSKGVYYRAMVGPFGTPDEAQQVCGNLKSAGGQCVVQRN